MGPGRPEPGELREIHKECLRLAGRHYSSKEIARMLGISKHTVDQRLRHATLQMGASNRFEAARKFCDQDQAQSLLGQYDPILYDAPYIPVNGPGATTAKPGRDQDQLTGTGGQPLQDAQMPYSIGDLSSIETLLLKSVSTGEVLPTTLSLRMKSLLVIGIAAVSLLAFGAAVAALEVLSRI